MTNTTFDLHQKYVRQLKAYLAGIGYNEHRDYVDAPYSVPLAASGKHNLVFNDSKAAANASLRWTALARNGFKEAV
jgi:hypothetical protein